MATAVNKTKQTNQASRARVDFRTTPEVKSLIERAAAINGSTVSDFITATVVERSRAIIEQNETRVLSDRDRELFLSLLDAKAPPNDALRAAATDFNQAVKEGDLVP